MKKLLPLAVFILFACFSNLSALGPPVIEKKGNFIMISYFDVNLQTDYQHLFRPDDIAAIECYKWTKTSSGRYSVKIFFNQIEMNGSKAEPRSINLVVSSINEKEMILNGIIAIIE